MPSFIWWYHLLCPPHTTAPAIQTMTQDFLRAHQQVCQHRRQQEQCPRERDREMILLANPKGDRSPPCQRVSLGWRAASPAQETRPRRPVALQIVFPDLLWGFWFSATRCSVNCHTEVPEQLSINSCRAQLTQAEQSTAEQGCSGYCCSCTGLE